MRLLIAADIFPPQSGGPATYAVTLANELVKRGIEVKIVSLNPNSDRSVVSCSMYRVSFKNKLLRYGQYLYLLWKHAKISHVIYAMGPVNAGLPALLAARLRGKPFVVKVVGDYAWEQWQSQKSKACPEQSRGIKSQKFIPVEEFQNLSIGGKIGLLRKVERLVCQRAVAVIVPSRYLEKIVIGWGVNKKNIAVIYNTIPFKKVDPVPKDEKEKWIVSVGRLVPWKGMDTLIGIMPEIIKEVPEARLKIIGEGPLLESLKSKVISLKLENYVELMGNLPRELTLAQVQAADIFVLNSGYEGLSHVLLEALKCNVPVLASNVGGNPELVSSKSLFAYNNKEEISKAIIKVLHDGLTEEQVAVTENFTL